MKHNVLTDIVTKKLGKYGWNERELTVDDLDIVCDGEGIVLFEVDMRRTGMYGVCEGVPVIILNKKLTGIKKVEVGFHEVGHNTLHSPAMCLFTRNSSRRHQLEAQAVAVIALIPFSLLETSLKSEELLSQYPAKLIKFRLEVLEYYGI